MNKQYKTTTSKAFLCEVRHTNQKKSATLKLTQWGYLELFLAKHIPKKRIKDLLGHFKITPKLKDFILKNYRSNMEYHCPLWFYILGNKKFYTAHKSITSKTKNKSKKIPTKICFDIIKKDNISIKASSQASNLHKIPYSSFLKVEDKKNFNKFLKDIAAKTILPILKEEAIANGFTYNKVSFKAQKSRWGSCTQQGNINLNVLLIFLPKRLIRYIVLHELCHLTHLNHSESFYKLLCKLTNGNMDTLEKELKATAWSYIPSWVMSWLYKNENRDFIKVRIEGDHLVPF